MSLNGGYMGLCEIDDLKVRVKDFNVGVKQDVKFYDHIIGLRDSCPDKLRTKRDVGPINPLTGEINYQKHFWRPGTKVCSGGFSFPATVATLQKVFDLAKTGDDFTLKFNYSCNDVERTFQFCKINSFVLSVTAGELVEIQVDVMSSFMEESTGSNNYSESEKLLTWDQVKITSISENPIQLFNLTVNNSCMPVYTAGANLDGELFPKKIRVGMQSVTGTIVYYIKGIDYVDLNKTSEANTIGVKVAADCGGFGGAVESFDEKLSIIYKPIERSSSLKALLHTLPFVGVGQALGV